MSLLPKADPPLEENGQALRGVADRYHGLVRGVSIILVSLCLSGERKGGCCGGKSG